MNKIIYIILFLLFLLQGANDYSPIILLLLLALLGVVFLNKGRKIKLPKYYIIAILVYVFYLCLGIYNNHENPIIDIKFQLFSFIFFFCLINLKFDFVKLLFHINTAVFVIYILLYFNLLPNIWSFKTIGFGGRVYGPAIIAINILLFYYLLMGKPFDKPLIRASLLGLISIALTTNFMNLAVFAVLIFLLLVNIRKLFNPIYFISILLVLAAMFWFLNSSFVPDLVASKMKYVYRPWEYGSLKTRLIDFNQAIANENFGIFKQILGEGFGASSQIYRYNPVAVSLSRTFNYQEIDNGFYYLYHRGGWSLLLLFIISHLYLLFRIKEIKAKIGFLALVFITCILSIHYFNYTFYLLVSYFVLYKNDLKKLTT